MFLWLTLFKRSCGGNNNKTKTRISRSLKAVREGWAGDEARVLIRGNAIQPDNKKLISIEGREEGKNHLSRGQPSEPNAELNRTPLVGVIEKEPRLTK